MIRLFFLYFLLLLHLSVFSQYIDKRPHIYLPFTVENGDTMTVVELQEVVCYPPKKFESKREEKNFNKLAKNVKKAYPYAVKARIKIDEINQHVMQIEGERNRKAYLDIAEKKLRSEFEKELIENLNISQGIILCLLIDRETGESTYNLVKELRSSLSAFVWQGVGRLFGYNLKTKFDPNNKDEHRDIEYIIHQIHMGRL